jgi:hypothetical protein
MSQLCSLRAGRGDYGARRDAAPSTLPAAGSDEGAPADDDAALVQGIIEPVVAILVDDAEPSVDGPGLLHRARRPRVGTLRLVLGFWTRQLPLKSNVGAGCRLGVLPVLNFG